MDDITRQPDGRRQISKEEQATISPEKKESDPESYWQARSIVDFSDIRPSQFHPEKEWLATHYEIAKPDGIIEEIDSTKPLIEIVGKGGITVEVPAYAVAHIISLHLKAEEKGSQLEENTLQSSFELLATNLPETIPFKDGIAAFEVDVHQTTGIEGVSSQREMLDKGIIDKDDLAILEEAKEMVFALNRDGGDEEKQTFIDSFNQKLTGRKVKLGIRAGAIVPFFEADKEPTTKLFVVIGETKDEAGKLHNCVFTLAPGRYMDKLPTDGYFIGKGLDESLSVADIWAKLRAGTKITPEETKLLDEQKKAQECWWQSGFVV